MNFKAGRFWVRWRLNWHGGDAERLFGGMPVPAWLSSGSKLIPAKMFLFNESGARCDMISILVATTFLTATVEWVEAYTIILAVALSIGWAPRAAGGGQPHCCVLAVLTGFGSFLLTRIPKSLRFCSLVVGIFLTLFGVRWLGKAVARGAGLEEAA